MFWRHNKNSEWIGTGGYNFTQPVSKRDGLTHSVRVALLFLTGKPTKTRALILKGIGEPRWKAKGQLACLFTALNNNDVIAYDKDNKTYVRGRRFKEFLEYCILLINKHDLRKDHRTEYLQMMREVSQTVHFILEDQEVDHVQEKEERAFA